MIFSKHNTTAISIALMCIAGAVGMVVAYVLVFYAIQTTREEVVQLEKQIEIVALANDTQQNMRRIVRDTEKERAAFEGILVEEGGIVPFLESLEGLGNTTHAIVTVSAVDVLPQEKKSKELQTLALIVHIEGTFKEVYHTLALLDVFPQPLFIQSVRLTQTPSEEGSFWLGEVKLSAHILP